MDRRGWCLDTLTMNTTQPAQATTTATPVVSAAQAATETQLVTDHLPLVHHVVHELLGRLPQHVARDDLVSAGMLGLAQAARSYNPVHGVPFDRHAANRIRGAILDELRAIDWASRSVRAGARRLAVADESLTARLGRAPTPGELAAELGLSRAEVDKLVADVHRATVLNYESVIADGDAEELLPTDHATPEQTLLGREQIAYLRDAIAALPERLRTVIEGYFFNERPMQELAAELGVTESRISQLRAEALVLLREGLNTHLNPELLSADRRPDGRAAKRKAAYYADIATRSDYHTRLSTPTPTPALATA
jgi:RNA polymerase sigma factor FliA